MDFSDGKDLLQYLLQEPQQDVVLLLRLLQQGYSEVLQPLQPLEMPVLPPQMQLLRQEHQQQYPFLVVWKDRGLPLVISIE